MSAVAGSPRAGLPARVSARVHASPYLATALGLTLLVAASLYLRTQAITAKFWIDEGLSVGIAHHGFWDIPTVLQQDGSPPLYYLLLHVWMAVAGGDGEARTHALSVALAMLAVPAAFVLGRLLFGARAGWAAAALTATLPFLTYYAQETRMYALIAFLGLVAAGAFGLAYGLRERRALPVFAVATAAMLYTHNWGAFLAAGLGIGWLVLVRTAAPQERRPLVRDGLLGFGAAVVLYLPWVPTLLEQARHTGAPWAERPPLEAIVTSITSLAGGTETGLLVLVLGIAGLLTLQEESRPRARAALGIGVALGTGIALAWLASQASPAWSTRYFSVFVGPALLLAGAGLVRFGKVGLVALALVLVLWFDPRDRQIKGKSDVYRVARTLQEEGLIKPNDLVVTAHPEQGPLLRYYLGPDYRFADAMGPVPDTRVFDWRDALDRLEAAGPRRTLDRLAPSVSPGQHLVLMLPIIRTGRWGAPWTELVRRRSAQWERAVDHDKRFQRIAPVPEFGTRPLPRGLRAVVYLRR